MERGETTLLRDLLIPISGTTGHESSLNEPNETPGKHEGECDRCGAELDLDNRGREIPHRCCACRDTGRVRVTVDRWDQQFGQTVPCPCEKATVTAGYEPVAHGVPPMLWRATFDAWQPANGAPRIVAENYVESWAPLKPFLVLVGAPGRGKSHLAAAVVREAWERHSVSGQFVEVPALMDRLRATYSADAEESIEGVMRWLERVPLLVLDDLGKDKVTDFVAGRIYRVINHRYGQQSPTVVTMNPSELGSLDDAVKSRLSDTRIGVQVQFGGKDYRPMSAA